MMKLKIVAVLLVLSIFVSFGASAQDAGTIVDVAAGNENFSMLVSLVEAAGLVDTLAGEGPFTVFAPTNDAFAKLDPIVLDYLADDTEALTRVLTYHVVAGQAVMSGDITEMMEPETVEGGALSVQPTEMGVMVNNATVVIADVAASNGVIHAVDTVLIPEFELEAVVPADVQGDVITAGSSTVFPLSQAVVAAFEAEGYTGEITVDSIGSGGGLERFCEAGETDIANASRPINEDEIAACAALATPRTPVEFRVGTDALAVVTNPANDWATDVTREQLAQIFGSAETWADVDPSWPAEPILRFIPGTDSGTFDYFVEEIFEEDPEPIQQAYGASTVQLSEDDNVLLEGVANNEFAIGFFGYAYYAQNAADLNILSIDGVEPNAANVANATYPLARPLFIYSDAGIIAEKPQVGQFINYYLTNVNTLISEVGYFPEDEYALRLQKLELLAAIHAGMM